MLLSFSATWSQSMVLVNPVVQVIADASTLTGAGEMVAEWPVTNISDVAISVKCSRSVVSAVPGTSNYFCWGVCFGETTNVSLIAQTIQAADTNHTFYAHYKPLGNAGETLITYCFFNMANPTDQACQTVSFCYESSCPISVQEIEETSLTWTGSNPIKGIGFMNYTFPSGINAGQLVVTNAQGALVKTASVKGNKGSILLNADDYAAGVYNFTLNTRASSKTIRLIAE